MDTLLITLLMVTPSVLGGKYISTVNVMVAPQALTQPQQPKPQIQELSFLHNLWQFNRVDCVLADIVPKVSQRIKLLKKCENDFLLNRRARPSYGRKTPYLGWRNIPIMDVWNMKDDSMSKEAKYFPQLPSGIGKFTESLYKNLEEISPNTVSSKPGNIAVSPLALELVLASVMAGARYNTKKQINRFLNVIPESLPLKYRSILSQLQLKKQTSIRLVNKVLLEESFFPVKDAFSRTLLEVFDTRIEKANFHAGAPAELEKLNHLVAENTEGHITNALTSDVVNEQTQLLLVNTLYFKAKWENQFQMSHGFNGDFFLPGGKSVKATYMSKDEIYYHYKEDTKGGYKMLEFPFLSGTDDPGLYSMIVVLPDEVNGLQNVERHLTKDDSWLKNFDLVSSADTEVVKPIIPRFTIDSKANLKTALNKMDVILLFEDNSDFGSISEKINIKTSKIYQRVYLDVNEKGCNVPSQPKSLPGTEKEIRALPLEFHAKHPFIFAIVQRITKTVLVMGRVMKPNFDELFANNSEDLEK